MNLLARFLICLEHLLLFEYLDLSWNMLEGEIPKSLGNSSHLQIISLCANKLRGSPDRLIGNVSCEAMVSLEYAVLCMNEFTGPIPDMRACPALRGVTFSGNKFTGALPLSLGELSKLNILDVSINSLEGTVFEANFRNLHELGVLDLSFNLLTIKFAPDWTPPFQLISLSFARCKMGQNIPKWIQTQTKLKLLDVSDAGLSCESPKWLWSFSPSLLYLNISFNNINGTIPDLSSTSFIRIHASSNKFSGPLPLFSPNISLFHLSKNMLSGQISSICKNPHLYQIMVLALSSNQLVGELPECWEKMPYLQYLNLANNSFSGKIPPSLSSLQYLIALHLRDNNLFGELPYTFRNYHNLQVIDIGGNKLTGNISWIGSNSIEMTYLILGDNRFHGTIPPQLCHLIYLEVLDLSKNNFSGDIPDCFYNITAMVGRDKYTYVSAPGMVYSYVSYDFHIPVPYLPKWNINDPEVLLWKGQEKEFFTTLGMLVLIDLSSNSLVGSIPTSLSSLKRLTSLNLSRNSLEGNIVPGFGEIERLEVIDLSRNHLSGEIPIDFAQLHFLSVLDLSNNNLTGRIPTSTQLQSFDPSVYARNYGLCGDPLPMCPNTTITDEGDDMEKKDGGLFLQSSTLEFCITLILGFIVGFWGVVGSLVLKRSWRIAYFRLMNAVGDWFYVNTMFLAKFKRG